MGEASWILRLVSGVMLNKMFRYCEGVGRRMTSFVVDTWGRSLRSCLALQRYAKGNGKTRIEVWILETRRRDFLSSWEQHR